MLEKITEQEISFMEAWHTVRELVECLFSNFDDMGEFEEGLGHSLRLYQTPMLSQEPLIDFETTAKYHNLSEKQAFKLRENVGSIVNVGARKYGKTQCTLKLDMGVSVLHDDKQQNCFYSIDEKRLRGVLEQIRTFCEHHPIGIMWKVKCQYKPDIRFKSNKSGWETIGVNMTIRGKDPGCFDNKTEILTDLGWKLFKDLTYKDNLLSMNPETNMATYYPIKKIVSEDYNGKMKILQSANSKFIVTPKHKILYYNREYFKFYSLEDNNLPKQIIVPSTFIWKGKNKEYFKLKGISNSLKANFKCKMEDWVAFVAWYLSEGTIVNSKDKHYRIRIGQKHHNLQLETIIKKMGLIANVRKDKQVKDFYLYTISNKLIVEHLKEHFGEKKNKRIPNYIKVLSPKYLKIFLDNYFLGDGCEYKGLKILYTSVKQLADDLQELAQKAGYKTHLREQIQDIKIRNKYFYKNYKMYKLSICLSKNTVFQKNKIKEIDYIGNVYDVEVEPYHTIFVRRNGCVMWSGNSQFYQIHAKKIWGEEVSFETQEIFEKRKESISELGAVVRLAGMTDFTKNSPIGKMFFDKTKKNRVCNLPQFCSPYWDDEEKADRIETYGGEDEPRYRVFVGGEVLTDSQYEFDMERIEPFINRKNKIIRYELKKDRFKMFKTFIIVERPKNADRIFIASDIGDGAKGSTEILIIAEIGENYKPLYNITLHNFKHDEQYEVLKYIIEKMEANVIAFDCGEALGRTLADDFEKLYKEENVVRYAGNLKVIVGFEEDENHRPKRDKNGKLIFKEEFMSEWSVRRQKELLYGGRVSLSEDNKFEKQFETVVSTKSGTRVIYACLNPSGDHYWEAWKVFCIAEWLKKSFNDTPKVGQGWGCGASSWKK